MRTRKRAGVSLLLVISIICVLMLVIQLISFTYLNQSTSRTFEQSLIETKMTETRAFAKLIGNGFYQFYSEVYGIFASNTWRNLRVSLEFGRLDSQYIEYAQMFWSTVRLKQMALSYIENVEFYLLDENKRLTSSSIVDIDAGSRERLEAIVKGNHGVSIVDGVLYFWVPQYYSVDNSLEDMRVVAIARVPKVFLRPYLAQFADENSDYNLIIAMREGGENHLYCALDNGPEAAQMLSGWDVTEEDGFIRSEMDGGPCVITWAKINSSLFLYEITSWNAISGQLEFFAQRRWMLSILILLCSLCFMGILYAILSRPIGRLRAALRDFRKGELSTRLDRTLTVEFLEVYDQFNRMAEQIQTLIEQKYMMQLLNAKAELGQLQYQINPHFLYNTYFNLRALLEEEEIERAAQYADMLGRYLGYITRSGQNGTLEEEVNHAETYGRIQQVRFGDRISMEFGVLPEAVKGLRVPRLILQPLIENAYEHGVKQRLEGGRIRVRFEMPATGVADIVVEDNGETLTQERLEELQRQLSDPESVDPLESIALLNIQKRLSLYYKNDSRLTVEFSEMGGLKCCLHIQEVREK